LRRAAGALLRAAGWPPPHSPARVHAAGACCSCRGGPGGRAAQGRQHGRGRAAAVARQGRSARRQAAARLLSAAGAGMSEPVAHVCQPDEEGKKGALCAQARVGPETLGGASCLKCLRKSRAQFTVTSSLQQPTSTCRVGRLQADPDQQTSEGCCCAEWDGCGGPERRGSGPHGLVCSGCEQHDAVRWPGRAESTGPVVPVVGSCCHACRASLRTP